MKQLPKIAVDRPVTFLMLALVVIGFGLFGLSRLSLNLYPDVSFPTITVYTTYDGVAPEDIETLISRPLEEQVGGISGLRRVRSLSSQGSSVIKLYFNWGTDLFQAQNDVRKQVDFARRIIPNDADQPIIFAYDPNQEPVMLLTLRSNTRSSVELRTFATQQLEQRFERIPGVASAETSGGLERQINVWMNTDAILANNLDIGSVAQRLRQENVQVPAGELIEGRMVYSLRTTGEFQNIEEIRDAIVAVRDGEPVRLRNIADIEDGVRQPIGNVRVQGEEGVILNIYRQSDVNIVNTAANIRAELENIRRTLPAGVHLDVLTDRSEFIELSIRNIYITALIAIGLVVLILLLFLRSFRTALIVAISIPVSIIATFSIMDFGNVTLNVISLSGLTLAVGLVVDNAVVVLENIFRFREDKYNGDDASIKGAQEVAGPIIVSTLTTVVVFLPILFVPGIAGFLFRDLALTISFALGVSTVVALTLIPLMTSRLFKPKQENLDLQVDSEDSLSSDSGNNEPDFNSSKGNFFNRLIDWYSGTLEKLLPKSGLVVGIAVLFLILTTPLLFRLGGEFFPQVDENAFVIELTREAGVNLFELEESFKQAENIIMETVPEARLIVSDYGDKRGVEGAEFPGGFRGVIRVELISSRERSRGQSEIVAALLEDLQSVPGATTRELRENPLNPDGDDGLIVNLYGFDLSAKQELRAGVIDAMTSIDGIVSASSSADEGRPEIRVVMDRERISRNGLSTAQVANALSDAVRGNAATNFIDEGLQFEVNIQLAADQKATTEDLERIQIRTDAGTWMPLANLVRIERYTGPSNILRINQERVTEIQADLAGLDLRTASNLVDERLSQIQFPDGYRYEIGGTAEEQRTSYIYLLIAFMVAATLAYMVMASQFESLLEPFIIIFTIPLALSGVIFVLALTGTPISVTALIGLILLSGIVVNNGIVMIDYIKILQARGIKKEMAIVTGAGRRLRPIIMTAATTILCMIPLAFELGEGAETWSPMARTVIGGLTASTILMLFFVPCLYYLFSKLLERFGFSTVNKVDPLAEA
ncbi:MAG: efflux RND transporter permease subunit [Balneolia bacterium]|nr:efflux RND transporter permease subunit [Balneolia bacterium]